jgi:hypothetical protein
MIWSEIKRHYSACSGYKAHDKYWIWPVKMTRPVGGQPFEYGTVGYLNGDDTSGALRLVQANHPNYWMLVPPGQAIYLGVGHSVHFSLGASVLGVGLDSESVYTSDLQQWYQAGNRNDLSHDCWGRDGDIYHLLTSTYAHVFYCYTLGPP